MNIKDRHLEEKPVSITPLFNGEGTTIAMQIMAGKLLKEHITTVPAFLICVEGEVVFENKEGLKETLKCGDFINIDPNVKHWVNAIVDSQLILIK